MKKVLSVLSVFLCAFTFTLPAVEVDIFRSEGDPRVAVFSIPASGKDAPVKNFVMERDGKKYYPQTTRIATISNFYANDWNDLPMPLGKMMNPPGEITTIEQHVDQTAKVFGSDTANDRFGRTHGSMGNVMFGDRHVEMIKDFTKDQLPTTYELSAW